MDYVFPKTKFVDQSDPEQQLDHIRSEVIEALQELIAGRMGDCDIEVMDIYLSCETYFRIREKMGIDIDGVRKAVFQKNSAPDRKYFLKE